MEMEELGEESNEAVSGGEEDGSSLDDSSSQFNATQNSTLPVVDYVLVFDPSNEAATEAREAFEAAMRKSGLRLSVEPLSPHKAFLKVFASFGRLAHEAEQIKLEMDLKNCPIDPDPPGLWDRLFGRFVTDDEVDFVSGPFEMSKLELFEGHEDELGFFRSSLRSYLVDRILTSLSVEGISRRPSAAHKAEREETGGQDRAGKRGGLAYLLLKGVFLDAFILHDQSVLDPFYLRVKAKNPDQYQAVVEAFSKFDDPRKELNDTWANFLKFQPLWKIRNYFGEKIGIYFAWQGVLLTFLWVPALCGLAIVFYGIFLSANEGLDDFQSCKCLWLNSTVKANASTLFGAPLSQLKRNATFLQNHCIKKELIDVLATDILGVVKQSFNNLCSWEAVNTGTLFLTFWKRKNATVSYEWDCNSYTDTEPDRPQFTGSRIIVDPITREFIWVFPGFQRFLRYLVSMVAIFFMIYAKLAEKLTDHENHQTQSDYQDALILKLFTFEFVNHYAILFYLAVVRPSDHNAQPSGIFGMGPEYSDTCPPGTCMSTLSFQVLLLMIAKPCVKFAQDIILPWGLRRIKVVLQWLRLKRVATKVEDAARAVVDGEGGAEWRGAPGTANPGWEKSSYLEREYRKPACGDFSLEELTEKVMQFGYVVMFTAAFPLAPFLALIVNALDMRIDARRLLWFNRRPIAEIASDIGMWESILNFLNFCGVITNAFLIISTSSLFDNNVDVGWVERLTVFLCFEHLLIVLMLIFRVCIPSVPMKVKLATRRLENSSRAGSAFLAPPSGLSESAARFRPPSFTALSDSARARSFPVPTLPSTPHSPPQQPI